MQTHFSEYIPLAAFILFAAFLGYVIWRGNYKIGAYIVQIAAALFLSSVVGFTLYILSSVMVTTWLLAGSSTFLMINAVVMQAVGATTGFAIVKRFGTSANEVNRKRSRDLPSSRNLRRIHRLQPLQRCHLRRRLRHQCQQRRWSIFRRVGHGKLAADRQRHHKRFAQPRTLKIEFTTENIGNCR